MNDKIIDGLLQERLGYERRNLKDRVAEVDKQLSAFGYKKAAPIETAAIETEVETATVPKARKKKG
jgi:hypothetical protein